MAENKSFERERLKAAYRVFQRFALEDQRAYYAQAVQRYRKAAGQANLLRATLALLTGLSAALAGLLVAAYLTTGSFANNGECSRLGAPESLFQDAPPAEGAPATQALRPAYCNSLEAFVMVLTVITIVAPALGAAFTTLADLYQWDRLASIYETALENLEVADAQSPVEDMPDLEYRASLRAYAEGALDVMRDESAQWGLSARAPLQLEKLLEEERLKAQRVGGSADDLTLGTPEPPAPDRPKT